MIKNHLTNMYTVFYANSIAKIKDTYAFLDNCGRIILIVFFFSPSGGGAKLQATAYLQNGHTSGHTHT